MGEDKPKKHQGIWSAEQLEPERERVRLKAAEAISRFGNKQLIVIPVPATARVQWFSLIVQRQGRVTIAGATPIIYSLLTGRQLADAPLQIRNNDSWKQGVRMQSKINFRDPGVEEWLAKELAACARSVGVELEVGVQVVLLDGGK